MQKNSSSNSVQVLWVAIGSLSNFALTILSAAILSRYFDKTEYGTYKQILYVYGTLLVVFSAGLPGVYSYFLPRYTLDEGKAIVYKVSKVLFYAGFLFSFFLFVFSGKIAELLNNPELSYPLKVFSPIPMFLLPTLGIEGIFATYKKTKFIAVYDTSTRILMLLFIVLPVILFKGNCVSAIYGWLVVSFFTFLMAFYFKRIPFKNTKKSPTTLTYKEIFSFSLPIVLASIWGMIIKSADQFYVSHYFGAEVFAEYSNGFNELPFVSMVTASTSLVLMPVFSKAIHEGNKLDEMLQTFRNALYKSALIIYPIVVFFIVYGSEIMTLLYSKTYSNSGIYFSINMILNFFNIIIFAPLIFALGATKFYSKIHFFVAIMAWIGCYLVVLVFNSPISIAVFSVSLSIFKVIIFFFFIAKKLEVNLRDLFPFQKVAAILIQTTLIIGLIYYFLKIVYPEINIYLKLVLSLLSYAILVLTTAMFFKINYFQILDPFLIKIKNILKN